MDCPFCFQLCSLCLESPSLDCPICKQLQDDHREYVHCPLTSNANELNHPTDLELFTSQNPTNILSEPRLAPPKPRDTPVSRRRDWTDEENRDFEKWITSNPKPTKQQKQDFADQHKLLTFSQVQNKINNWRSGRNIQRKKTLPSQSSIREELVSSCADTLPEIFQGLDWDLSLLGQLEPCANNGMQNEIDSTGYAIGKGIEQFDVILNQDEEVEARPNSSVSSISRYIECPDLEANREDIEMTLRKASQEDLRVEDALSDCMRWPSLRRQGLISQSESTPKENGEKMSYCDRCKELGLMCNMEIPCIQCNEAGLPCSNCLLPIPDPISHSSLPFQLGHQFSFVYNDKQNPLPKRWSSYQLIVDNNTNGPVDKSNSTKNGRDQVYSTLPVAPQRKSTSRAQSVTSARTSNSGGSTHSARYSIKLNRRISANNRRFSATEVATSSNTAETLPRNHIRSISLQDTPDKRKSQQSKRNSAPDLPSPRTADMHHSSASTTAPKRASWFPKTAPTRKNDGRDDYFSCLICSEIFESMIDVHVHERAFHSEKYCTFCGLAFGNRTDWHDHERSHMNAVYKECDNILWRCGICSLYGVREPRRYIHIRGHWEGGNILRDWKGGPQIMPLDTSVIEALESMTEDRFMLNAESFLTAFLRRSLYSILPSQNWIEPNEMSTELEASYQQRTQSSPGATSHLENRTVDTSQQMFEHNPTRTGPEDSNQQMKGSSPKAKGLLEDRAVDTSQREMTEPLPTAGHSTARTVDKFERMVEHNHVSIGSEAPSQHTTEFSPKVTNRLEERAIDSSRQMKHGLFASLRRRMPLFRARLP